jgi:hypothetical protein
MCLPHHVLPSAVSSEVFTTPFWGGPPVTDSASSRGRLERHSALRVFARSVEADSTRQDSSAELLPSGAVDFAWSPWCAALFICFVQRLLAFALSTHATSVLFQ